MKPLSMCRFFAIIALLFTISCNQEKEEVNTIVVCGNLRPSDDECKGFYTTPSGERIYLKSSYANTAVYDMVQAGNDIYCAGTTWNSPDFKIAVYWKNGEPTYMTDGKYNASIQQIAVNGTDVYCVGCERCGSWHTNWRNEKLFRFNVAKCWKNGKLLYTLTNGKKGGCANGIYIDPDNRVHIVGFDNFLLEWYQYAWVRTKKVCFWIDGKRQDLDNHRYSDASTIVGDGKKIYISGWISNFEYDGDEKAVYWENGWRKALSDGGQGNSYFHSARIFNGNYYLCGYYEESKFKTPAYWVNGQYVPLREIGASVFDIAVVGEDVYCAGDDGYAPGIWKNGKFKKISEESGYLTGIIVYPNTTESL
ncbi:MAG: hypothetical protein IKM37_03640 [Alistipes sp.]|nr:hypothetical protein [Alistipes sp.]